uniref:SS18 N-terminal domain-containing protein n=1 Tax=Trichobilharzia regenti TaxID=157069 RepID=A0AA85JHS3_TRIRE
MYRGHLEIWGALQTIVVLETAAIALLVLEYVIDEEAVSVVRLLDENDHIIELIADFIKKGRFSEAAQMQGILQRNLVYLVSLVDQYNLNGSDESA